MATDAVLEQLKAGVVTFQTNVYPPLQETYTVAASTPQQPKTLFITCADSRIDAETITSSGPGDLFITRNIGNMVPAYGEMLGGVSAVIEYAVSALKVKHVVVCGHTDCGAMKALLDPQAVAAMPTVKSWLTNAAAALSAATSTKTPEEDPAEFLHRLTEQNVLLQLQHLQTHPSVAGAMAAGELTISGWVYEIGTGTIRISEEGNRKFHAVATEIEAGSGSVIVPKTPQIWRMVQYIGWPLVTMAAYDTLVVVAYKVLRWDFVAFPHVPLALYGSAIGVILGFRNNSSYARWWEARTLWGAIVNNSRTMARQVLTTMRAQSGEEAELAEMQRRIVYHQIAFVHALRQQLRGLDAMAELAPFLDEGEVRELEGQKNLPVAIQTRMGVLIQESESKGWINPLQWQAMDSTLNDLADAQGGAERIKNTPMPKQYDYFPRFFVQIYCVLLPLAMVTNLGWFTPLGSTLVAFIFLALDKIGRDLEDPFDNTVYDVPLTAISTTIETNLKQMLGDTDLPQAHAAVRGVLW